ncbi:MAG: hypothetical protein QOF78_2734 [Phycisphaerales bacterium]|nr:hypothetical protein [Phycisphaerales bacterium]
MIGNLVFGVPLGISIVAVMIYLQIFGAPTLEAKLKVAAVVALIFIVDLGLAALLWPFVTPFESPLWKCWNCDVELIHRYALCPRCGAPPKPVPQVRAARVMACGSDESPARADSA